MYKYKKWAEEELCKAEKELLMTMSEIRKERKDDDEKSFDDEQLDMISKCIDGIKDIYAIRCMWHTHKADISAAMSEMAKV